MSSCSHGAPALPSTSPFAFAAAVTPEARAALAAEAEVASVALASSQLLCELAERDADPVAQLDLCAEFCSTQAAEAAKPAMAALLAAAAVDELIGGGGGGASNSAASRRCLRAAVFFECYGADGVRFLEGFRGALAVAPPTVSRFLEHCDAAADEEGLRGELRRRVPCGCLAAPAAAGAASFARVGAAAAAAASGGLP